MQKFSEFVVVFLGGGLGAVCRFWLGAAIQRLPGPDFPRGTFVVNIIGCLLAGVVAELVRVQPACQGNVRLFLMVGILGGFTTFSTFGYETLALFQAGKVAAAGINAVGQVLVGLLMVSVGYYLTHRLTGG